MSEIAEQMNDAVEKARESKLNTTIAAMVALTATFMALCNVKSGNVVQGMAKAQVASNNAWSYYQAKSTKENLADSSAKMLEIQRDTSTITPEQRVVFDTRITSLKKDVERYEKEKNDIKKQAEDLEKEYDRLNVKDDQFDIGEACCSVGIALFGVTALTQKRWLLFIGLAFAGFGILIGIAGFVGWNLRPEWMAKALG